MKITKWKKLSADFAPENMPDSEEITTVQRKWLPSGLSKVAPYYVVLILVVLLLVGLFNVWTRMDFIQLGYEISTLQTKNKELRDRSRELSLELSSLESPGELEKMAKKQGLQLPSVGRIIHVPK